MVQAAIALDYVERVGMRQSLVIKPALIVEAYGVYYQRVAFPLANGVAPPGGIVVRGMAAAVHVDFTKVVASFVEHDHFTGSRNDLEGMVGQQDARDPQRIAIFDEGIGIGSKVDDYIRPVSVFFLVEFRSGRRLQRGSFERKVEHISASAAQPDAGKVGY